VGITRAEKHIYLTGASSRTLYGNTAFNRESRFLREIPDEIIEVIGEKKNKKAAPAKFDGKVEKKPESLGSFAFKSVNDVLERKSTVSTSAGKSSTAAYNVGDVVSHKKFGTGVIRSVEKEKDDFKLEIIFDKCGMKRLMAAYANLTKLN